MTAAWKKLRFILSVRSDFHIVDSLLIAVHVFVNLVSMSFSVDSTLLPRYVYLSTSLRGVPFRVEMSPVWFIWMHYMDANKTAGEETRWQLHKNAACNPEQVLAATPHKTPTVRPPAPYHENYSS